LICFLRFLSFRAIFCYSNPDYRLIRMPSSPQFIRISEGLMYVWVSHRPANVGSMLNTESSRLNNDDVMVYVTDNDAVSFQWQMEYVLRDRLIVVYWHLGGTHCLRVSDRRISQARRRSDVHR
jgi:hypothetical protein